MSNKIARIKVLKNDKGIQYLLNEGYKIFGNPIYMHDLDYKLILYTENIVTDDPLWNEIVINGCHGEKTIELFKEEYFIDAVANSKSVAFLTADNLKYSRICGKIRGIDNMLIAFADIVSCEKPFEEDDITNFEVLCKKISKEMSKNEFYQTYGNMHHEFMIRKLIDGQISDKRLYTNRVAEIYNGLKNYIYVMVADAKDSNMRNSNFTYFIDKLKQMRSLFKYAVYSGYIIIIVSSDETKLNVKRDLKRINDLIKGSNICVGISNGFENLFELWKYYREATEALNYGLNNNCGKQMFLYSDLPYVSD